MWDWDYRWNGFIYMGDKQMNGPKEDKIKSQCFIAACDIVREVIRNRQVTGEIDEERTANEVYGLAYKLYKKGKHYKYWQNWDDVQEEKDDTEE